MILYYAYMLSLEGEIRPIHDAPSGISMMVADRNGAIEPRLADHRSSYSCEVQNGATLERVGYDVVVPSRTKDVRFTHSLQLPQNFLKNAMIYASDGCTWQGEEGSPSHFVSFERFMNRKKSHALLHPGGGKDLESGVGVAYDYFFLTNPDIPDKYYLVATLPSFDAREHMELRVNEEGLDVSFISDYEGTQGARRKKDCIIVEADSYEALGKVFREEMGKRITMPKSDLEHGFSWYTWGGSGRNPTELATQIQQLWHLNKRLVREGLERVTRAYLDDNFMGIREWGDFYKHPNEIAFLNRFVDMCNQIDVNPCVWLAPLLAADDSELFKEHPDWFLRDENGNPVVFPIRQPIMRYPDQPAFSWDNLKEQMFNQEVYVLDFSKREVKDHIVALFARMQKAGVKGIKFDYGLASALGGNYANKLQTSVEHFRELLAEITEACPGLEIQMTSCRPSDVFGFAHSLRSNPDSSVPFDGLITNNVVGNIIRWIAEKSPFAQTAQEALHAINSEHYFRSAFSAIVSGDLLEGLIEMVSDQIHFDHDRLKIRRDVAGMTHDQIIKYAKKFRVTLGDALHRVDADMQDQLIVFLKRLDAVIDANPVNLMEFMEEFSATPLDNLSPLASFFIWLFMPPSMAQEKSPRPAASGALSEFFSQHINPAAIVLGH